MSESDNFFLINPPAREVGGNDLPDLKIYGYQVYEKLSEHLDLGKISYLGIDLKLDRLVVIKEWRRLDLAKPNYPVTANVHQQKRQIPSLDYGNYLPEIERLQQLDHLNIPRYLNSFATPTGFCVVREYQSGVSLAELGDLPLSDIKLVAEAVLNILEDLHRSTPIVIHHNIKPENIIVNSEQTLKIYLVDFGLHQSKDPHASMGTPGFLPPPFLFSAEQTANPDIYSLGVSLICLMTGTATTQAHTLFDNTYRPQFKHLIPDLADPQSIQFLEKMVDPRRQHQDLELNQTAPVEHRSRSKHSPAQLKQGFEQISKPKRKIKWVPWGIGVSILSGAAFIGYQNISPENSEISPAEITKNQAIAQKAGFAASDRGQMLKQKYCPNCNLNYQNFSKAELSGANAPQANLTGANFSEANLTLAIFRDADLSSANFSKANLHQAAFYGAKLIGTNLVGANLSNSKLVYAKLKGAWLRDANLANADLKFAEVQQVDLTRANLTGADLSNADLSYTNLHKAILAGANLTGANLTGATMPDGSIHP
jgi:uncharacterized protein YjbI with pentapeptide repeats